MGIGQTRVVNVEGKALCVEVADSFISRMRGLSFRKRIATDGMLFEFPFRARWSLWILGMKFAIDIIWLDGEKIIGIERGIKAPQTLREAITLHRPAFKVTRAIELTSPGNIEHVFEVFVTDPFGVGRK